MDKEFIDYLILNGIDRDTWETLKREEVDSAQKIVELFSDVVFEKILRETRYLQYSTPQSIKIFNCLPESITLIGLDVQGEDIDLTTQEGWASAKQNIDLLSLYTQTKPYNKEGRELEIFTMMERGCVRVDGSSYLWLKQLL